MPSIRDQAKELKKEGLGGMSDQMREMIAYWRDHRPKMYKRLKAQKILQDFALVLDVRVTWAMQKAVSRGISLSDSQRMYASDLLMTPEDEETTG